MNLPIVTVNPAICYEVTFTVTYATSARIPSFIELDATSLTIPSEKLQNESLAGTHDLVVASLIAGVRYHI